MFGRQKSQTEKFIMAQGRAVGNIRKIKGPPAGTGKHSVGKPNMGHVKAGVAKPKVQKAVGTEHKGSKVKVPAILPVRKSLGKQESTMGEC